MRQLDTLNRQMNEHVVVDNAFAITAGNAGSMGGHSKSTMGGISPYVATRELHIEYRKQLKQSLPLTVRRN